MLLYRSLVVGLVAACFILLARHRVEVRVIHDASATAKPQAQPPQLPPQPRDVCMPPQALSRLLAHAHPPAAMTLPTLIDVSATVPRVQMASLVHLASDEHIVTFEDHHGAYTDVEVRGPRGDRRVLLLVH